MSETFVLYLHADDLSRPSWAIVDANQVVLRHAWRDTPDALAEIIQDKKLIVVAPAQDFIFLSLILPQLNQRKLMQAIPYALEDKMIEDVSALHFAIVKHDEHVDVAIVNKEKMQQWLTKLAEWQLKPDLLIPETLTLPHTADVWHVRLTDDYAAIKTENYRGFMTDIDNAAALLSLSLQETLVKPTQLIFHDFRSEDKAIDVNFLSQVEKFSPENLIVHIAKNCQQTNINLLQNTFAVKKNLLKQFNKMTKAMSYVAAALIALIFIYPLGSYLILAPRAHQIENEIKQIYAKNFPESKTIVAPKIRLQEKLERLTANVENNRVMILIAQIAKAKQQTDGLKIKKMEYQNNQLLLNLTAANSQDVDAFSNYLNRQGLVVKQQNVNLIDGKIDAALSIE